MCFRKWKFFMLKENFEEFLLNRNFEECVYNLHSSQKGENTNQKPKRASSVVSARPESRPILNGTEQPPTASPQPTKPTPTRRRIRTTSSPRPAARDDDIFLLGSAALQPHRRQVCESPLLSFPLPSPNGRRLFRIRAASYCSISGACLPACPATAHARSCGVTQRWSAPQHRVVVVTGGALLRCDLR